MYTLNRWNPIRDMMTLSNVVDRFFDDSFFAPQLRGQVSTGWTLPLDVVENEDQFIVKASIPGIHPEDLDVTLNDNVLTIKGELSADEEREQERYHLRERRFGRFVRSISLPTKVESDAVEARYEHGVLTLLVPKAEEVKPKKISVTNGYRTNGHKQIEGEKVAVAQ